MTTSVSRYVRVLGLAVLSGWMVGATVAAAQPPVSVPAPLTNWRQFPTVAPDLAQRWQPATLVGAPVVTGTGPAVQVETTAPATLLRHAWTLSGTYAVGATFTSAPDVAPTDVGVVVGGGTLACIVAPDGTARFEALGSPLAIAAAPVRRTPAIQLLVRVTPAGASCLVNGKTAVTVRVPVTPVGAPGIYVGRSGTVLVAGFTLETAAPAAGGL